ncbi:MAG: hypothetical protein ACI4FZ_11655 [Lachnospiraceae bacterium]
MKKSAVLLLILFIFAGCQNSEGQENPTAAPVPTEKPAVTAAPTPFITLSASVTYTPVMADGITRVLCNEGEGIELDLNGDGAAEQIYTAEEGIYINGILQELCYPWRPVYKPFETDYHQPWEEYYIVDIDVSDGYYNLVFFYETADPVESITYYDSELKEIDWLTTFGSMRPFSTAEYDGDGTLLVRDVIVDFLGIQYGADLTYRLNDKGTLERMDSFIATPVPYELELLEPLVMYTEPDDTGEEILSRPQKVYSLGTLGDWAKVRLEDGTEAWLHFKDVSGEGCILDNGKRAYDVFGGYPDAG